jgi:hypothetical protein
MKKLEFIRMHKTSKKKDLINSMSSAIVAIMKHKNMFRDVMFAVMFIVRKML